MSYFNLLCNRKYFDIFLKHFNSKYCKQTGAARSGEEKEPHYSALIKRYYKIDGSTFGGPIDTSVDVTTLISNRTHICDAYESLRKEFLMGRRGLKLFPFEEFWDSIQTHKEKIVSLTCYRMESIAPGAIPGQVLDKLKQLFCELKVVPPKGKPGEEPKESPKLVAVSKLLHFLLPDLVMPVDRAKVLRFMGKRGDVPSDQGRQFAWFTEVFEKYIALRACLQLTSISGDDNWWNISVPKRIDNAIIGFWDIFNDDNLERIICGNTEMLLKYLNMG